MDNVKKLIYKYLKLLVHPSVIVYFVIAALMGLIPEYPRFVGPFYILIGVMTTMTAEAQYRDKEFCGVLPVSKSDSVKAWMIIVIMMEIGIILCTIPCAIISSLFFDKGRETVMIRPNLMVLVSTLLGYSAANSFMISANYRKQFKINVPSFLGMLMYFVVSCFIEMFITNLPGLEFMRTNSPSDLLRQLPYAIAAIGIYALSNYLICRKSIKNYEMTEI